AIPGRARAERCVLQRSAAHDRQYRPARAVGGSGAAAKPAEFFADGQAASGHLRPANLHGIAAVERRRRYRDQESQVAAAGESTARRSNRDRRADFVALAMCWHKWGKWQETGTGRTTLCSTLADKSVSLSPGVRTGDLFIEQKRICEKC